jgi:hypothetical protein
MRVLMIAAALALVCGPFPANAQTFDSHGKCHGLDGKITKTEACAKMVRLAPLRCRDANGHFAKCGSPGAHPVK